MNKRQSIIILSLVVGLVALAAYGLFTTSRIRKLEQRLAIAEERLRKVEADGQPRVDPLRGLQAEHTPSTNGGFLFDGVRPYDPIPPWDRRGEKRP